MKYDNKAIFTIGTAAEMLDVHPRTLRIYEEEGLIKPLRKGKWRYFTVNDLKWIECLREMIHDRGISIPAIKKLLSLTLCWNINECSLEKRRQCPVIQTCWQPGKEPKPVTIVKTNAA